MYRVQSGIVTGRSHVLAGKNCQDNVKVIVNKDENPYIVGCIADGCGTGKYSEAGSRLAVEYAVRESIRLLSTGINLESIPQLLYWNLVDMLNTFISLYHFKSEGDKAKFIEDHLLFTLIGFIITDEGVIIFASGDGVIVVNNDIHIRDENNSPLYLAYHLVKREMLVGTATELPNCFDLYEIPADSLERLLIGSDAWFDELEVLNELWGFKNPSALQRKLNVLSQKEKRLSDDASIITVEYVQPPEEVGDESDNQ